MRLTSTTVAVLCLLFSLSPTALGNSEIEGRGGEDDGHGRDNSPCFPFILNNSDCVRGRCKESQKCELGFSLDPIRLCCVRDHYPRGNGDSEYGNGGSASDHDGHGENCGCPPGEHDGNGGGKSGHKGW